MYQSPYNRGASARAAAPSTELPHVREMLNGMSSVESISDARRVMMGMLQELLRYRIHNTFQQEYESARALASSPQEIPRVFQDNLKNIEHWNRRIVGAEVAEIRLKRPDLDELITGAFVSTFMVLASVGGQSDDEIKLQVPSAETFVHECYIAAGGEIYSMPFLYTENDAPQTMLKNRESALKIIDRCIEKTVHARLSLQDVMRFARREALPPQPLQRRETAPTPLMEPREHFARQASLPADFAPAHRQSPLTQANLRKLDERPRELGPNDSISQQQSQSPRERTRVSHSRHSRREHRDSSHRAFSGSPSPRHRSPSGTSRRRHHSPSDIPRRKHRHRKESSESGESSASEHESPRSYHHGGPQSTVVVQKQDRSQMSFERSSRG